MDTANHQLDAVLAYLREVHLEALDIKSGVTEDGTKWTSISPLEFQKHWKNDLEVRRYVFKDAAQIKEIKSMLFYLAEEKLINSRAIHNYPSENEYCISFKGRLFIENGGHVEQSNRARIDYNLKGKQLTKTSWDISKMKIVFYFALIGFIFSMISFGLNLLNIFGVTEH